jgi:hypothetical protein
MATNERTNIFKQRKRPDIELDIEVLSICLKALVENERAYYAQKLAETLSANTISDGLTDKALDWLALYTASEQTNNPKPSVEIVGRITEAIIWYDASRRRDIINSLRHSNKLANPSIYLSWYQEQRHQVDEELQKVFQWLEQLDFKKDLPPESN